MSTSTEPRPVATTTDDQPPRRWWSVPPKLPFLTRRNRLWWYPLFLVVAGVGAIAIGMRLLTGLSMTELTSQVPWGAWVAFYIYFGGLSAVEPKVTGDVPGRQFSPHSSSASV